jgi:hypothetical protein
MGDAHLLRLEERRNWSRSRTGAHCQRRRRHPCHRGDTGVSQRRRPMFTAHSARTGCRLFRRACLPCSCYKACLATPPLPFRSAPLLPPPHPFLLRLLASSASASTPPRPASASRSLLLLLASAPGQPPALPRRRGQSQALPRGIQGTEAAGAARRRRQDGRRGDGGRAGRRGRRGGHQQQGRLRAGEEDHPQERPLPGLPEQAPLPADRRRAQLPPGSLLRLPSAEDPLATLLRSTSASRVSPHVTSLSGWDGWGCTCTGRRISSHSSVAPGRKLLQSPAPARRHSLLWLRETNKRFACLALSLPRACFPGGVRRRVFVNCFVFWRALFPLITNLYKHCC